jgi:hypothetical protein
MSSSPVICHQAQGLRLLPNAKKVLGAAESGRCLQLIHLLVSEAQPQRRFALRPQLLFKHQGLIPADIRTVAPPG